MMQPMQAKTVVAGSATGELLVLTEPLSLWGGLDPETGEIIDKRHPNAGTIVIGKVLALPSGRGSSSASSILLEAVRGGTAPAAIITAEVDGILALGAAVAQELYGKAPPILQLDRPHFDQLQSGQHLQISEEGKLTPI
jgi:uncharacterized protein